MEQWPTWLIDGCWFFASTKKWSSRLSEVTSSIVDEAYTIQPFISFHWHLQEWLLMIRRQLDDERNLHIQQETRPQTVKKKSCWNGHIHGNSCCYGWVLECIYGEKDFVLPRNVQTNPNPVSHIIIPYAPWHICQSLYPKWTEKGSMCRKHLMSNMSYVPNPKKMPKNQCATTMAKRSCHATFSRFPTFRCIFLGAAKLSEYVSSPSFES